MELIVEFAPVADDNGVIRDRSPQTPPLPIRITEARVRTRTGCSHRNHIGRATFSGGATYDSGPRDMIDCQDLVVPLDISVPGFQETVMRFEIDGFEPGETIEVVGTLTYHLDFFLEDLGIAREDAIHLPGLTTLASQPEIAMRETHVGSRINLCKSLIHKWFSLFDVRTKEAANEIAALLADSPSVQFSDTCLRCASDFLQWYEEHCGLVRRGYHEIDTIRVQLHRDSAQVDLTLVLHAELANGNHCDIEYFVRTELIELDTPQPKVKTFTATPVPPKLSRR